MELLRPFAHTGALMQREDILERVAYEFVEDCVKDGVYYAEVRFAPQLHTNNHQTINQVLKAVNRGLEKGKRDMDLRNSKFQGQVTLPSFNYGIITCAMRYFEPQYSAYYKTLWSLMPNSDFTTKARVASVSLVHEIIHSRDKDGIPIVAFDIAGAEDGFPPHDFIESYRLAHKNFFSATVHAGEAYGPESIYGAMTDLYAHRIGHGTFLFSSDKIKNPKVKNKERYVQELVKYIGETRTTLEVCPNSNLLSMPHLKNDMKNHPLKLMLQNGLSVTINTDNTLVCHTTLPQEFKLALECYPMNTNDFKMLVLNGFESSFWAGNYLNKQKYINHVSSYYDQVCREYGYEKF